VHLSGVSLLAALPTLCRAVLLSNSRLLADHLRKQQQTIQGSSGVPAAANNPRKQRREGPAGFAAAAAKMCGTPLPSPT